MVPLRYRPGGKLTVPPVRAAASAAACIAAVSLAIPSPLAPNSRTSKDVGAETAVPACATASKPNSRLVIATYPDKSPAPAGRLRAPLRAVRCFQNALDP